MLYGTGQTETGKQPFFQIRNDFLWESTGSQKELFETSQQKRVDLECTNRAFILPENNDNATKKADSHLRESAFDISFFCLSLFSGNSSGGTPLPPRTLAISIYT